MSTNLTPKQKKDLIRQQTGNPDLKFTSTIDILTNKQQLTFIQECIKVAIKTNPAMARIKDEYDSELGQLLIDVIDATLDMDDPEAYIHGFIM
ncbi:MAG: hypothetical protein EO766_17825 [Hydrotalea sp. AMD]|uniref:hypothetical protein n=1 Tax=Hydrotalea sp. AMD TaxID=2501297 RepID=UPI0010254E8C|nr:hypothetical protein [Hydrotalea sp. AMD]RWZ83185.1 MAG: hypothetical protein EO766_17825 [Hydrotalea sp. AMD]